MDKFSNVNKNLPNAKIFSKRSTRSPLYQSFPIEEEQNLIISDDFKLELFYTYIFNLRGENSTFWRSFFHYRDKRLIKEIFDVAKDILEHFWVLSQHI